MSFFASLFRKRPLDTQQLPIKTVEIHEESKSMPVLHLKGEPDIYGLYPAELIMLSIAERYEVSETDFPRWLIHKFEIYNPANILRSLHDRMFLETGSATDYLPRLKLAALKEIAVALNISDKGKKAEIIERLAGVPEDTLGNFIKERMWRLTSKGIEAIKANPYIQYFLEKHSYDIAEVGVNIWTINNAIIEAPKMKYRDIIYGQLNSVVNEMCIQIGTNSEVGTGISHRYCECYRIMSLFIEEEGRSYVDVLNLYSWYLFERINVYGGLSLLNEYRLRMNGVDSEDTCIENYYNNVQLYPFHKEDLFRILGKLNADSYEIRKMMIESFARTRDVGIMSADEAVDFIILELSGDVDKSRELACKLAKNAIKKVKKMKRNMR